MILHANTIRDPPPVWQNTTLFPNLVLCTLPYVLSFNPRENDNDHENDHENDSYLQIVIVCTPEFYNLNINLHLNTSHNLV